MGQLKDNPIILSLLLITFFPMLAYLLLVPYLGFYSEDFFFGYIGHFHQTTGIINSLVIDRPFNGYLLALTYALLGDNVFFWHLITFFIRLAGGYILFFLLLKIWPNKISIVTFVTLLFLLYPGFLQQTLPLGYQVHVLALTAWVASLMFTIYSVKTAGKPKLLIYSLFALILQILTLINLEFFIGMEVLRFLLIIHILKIKFEFSSLKKKFLYWSPYIISTILFILWRVLAFKSVRPETDINWVAQTYYSNPSWIIKIPIEIIQSFLHIVIFAYFLPLGINFIRLPIWNSVLSLALGFGSALLLFHYYKKSQIGSQDKNLGKQLFLIGLISVAGSLIPIILSGRFVREYSVYDRYTITSIIGVSFLIIGFLLFKFSNTVRYLIILLIVALSITSHLMNGFYRADYWNKQKDLWWQLYWRAPNIEKNAMLILDFPERSDEIPFKDIINKVQWYRFYWAEEQIWSAGNLFFNYNNPPSEHFYGDFLQDKGVLEKIEEGAIETFNNRNIIYTRDFKKSIIITTPSNVTCLHVLDGNKLVKAGPLVTPPKQIFGSEPPHSWCYFFQKASLARQLKDWDKLSQLKKEVLDKNLKPKDPNEWLPFTRDLR